MGPFRDGWTRADVEAVLLRGDPDELLYVPIVVSLSPPDCAWAEDLCVRLAAHPDARIRANAITGLGHLARVARQSNLAIVAPIIKAALTDSSPQVRGRAGDAADDIEHFLGWQFSR
jgi:hypothetical protein